MCLTADPGTASLIPTWSHPFARIDHEIISTAILLLPSADSRYVVVSYMLKYVHQVLVNRFVKLANYQDIKKGDKAKKRTQQYIILNTGAKEIQHVNPTTQVHDKRALGRSPEND